LVEFEDPRCGISAHELQIVRRHQNGHPHCVDLPEQVQDTPSGPLVEISSGLVGQKEERLTGEGARDGDALLLTSRDLTHRGPCFGRESHLTQEPLGSRQDLFFWRTDDFEGEGDVFESGAAGEKPKILKHVPDLPAQLPHVSPRGSKGREPARTYLSVGRSFGQVREPQSGRFS